MRRTLATGRPRPPTPPGQMHRPAPGGVNRGPDTAARRITARVDIPLSTGARMSPGVRTNCVGFRPDAGQRVPPRPEAAEQTQSFFEGARDGEFRQGARTSDPPATGRL